VSGCLPPGGVAGQALGQVQARGLEFIPDESQAQEPAAEGVLGVVRLRPRRAGGLGGQRLMADGQAKLDVAFDLARVECAVEGAELDGVRGPLGGKGRVQVEQVMCSYT